MMAKYFFWKIMLSSQGRVQYYDIPQMLKNADVLALCRPANHQAEVDSLPRWAEYLSTGNPVLVTNVGDMELYIKDGVNGSISKADDVEDV